MKVTVLCFFLAVAFVNGGIVVPSTTFVRSPAFDSAIVKSDRVGGSFSYSTVEGHGYAAYAYPYYYGAQYVVPASYYTPTFVSSPAYLQPQYIAANPVFGATFVNPVEEPAKAEEKPGTESTSSNEDSVAIESA